MKCQILFSRKNKNITNVSSAELAKRVWKINVYIFMYFTSGNNTKLISKYSSWDNYMQIFFLILTLKAFSKNKADNILEFFFYHFPEKIRPGTSYESPARHEMSRLILEIKMSFLKLIHIIH